MMKRDFIFYFFLDVRFYFLVNVPDLSKASITNHIIFGSMADLFFIFIYRGKPYHTLINLLALLLLQAASS